MKTLFAVTRIKSAGWDESLPMRSQALWDEHAAFMDQLVADGLIVLGGPIGGEGRALLIFDAADESEIESVLARDPWSAPRILETESILRWTILLERSRASL